MRIRQDPITKLWCREDGAVLMAPNDKRFKTFRWTFGSNLTTGYKQISLHGKTYLVHRVVCRAFNGPAPGGKPEVDHINRTRGDNRSENLHWVSHKENSDNQSKVDQALEEHKVRQCEDRNAYDRAHYAVHHEQISARRRAYRETRREEIKARDKAYSKTYYESHCEECKARWAAKAAKMKAQGLTRRKGPNGKYGWYPRVRKSEAA